MNHIFFKNTNGAVVMAALADNCGLTQEEIIKQVVPDGVDYYVVDTPSLPTDTTFVSAWAPRRNDAGEVEITVDMPKARDIGHALRREQRQALLAPLDVEINHAIANSAKVAEIEAQRQTIRDANAVMQTAIDAATTPEAIEVALGIA